MREEQNQRIIREVKLPFIIQFVDGLRYNEYHLKKLERYREMVKNGEEFARYDMNLINEMYEKCADSIIPIVRKEGKLYD